MMSRRRVVVCPLVSVDEVHTLRVVVKAYSGVVSSVYKTTVSSIATDLVAAAYLYGAKPVYAREHRWFNVASTQSSDLSLYLLVAEQIERLDVEFMKSGMRTVGVRIALGSK